MNPDTLSYFRCPLDKTRQGELTIVGTDLQCPCGVKFPIRNGIPVLVAEAAVLPEGCRSQHDLPCQGNRR